MYMYIYIYILAPTEQGARGQVEASLLGEAKQIEENAEQIEERAQEAVELMIWHK